MVEGLSEQGVTGRKKGSVFVCIIPLSEGMGTLLLSIFRKRLKFLCGYLFLSIPSQSVSALPLVEDQAALMAIMLMDTGIIKVQSTSVQMPLPNFIG